MRAITDIPANTPRPIGNTDNLVPGNWKAAALEVVESAAEVPEGELAAAAAGEMVFVALWEAEAAALDALAAVSAAWEADAWAAVVVAAAAVDTADAGMEVVP